MGEPGGGKSFITPRILRHLHLLSIANFNDDTMKRIFSSILFWFFSTRNFSDDILRMENKII